MQFFHLIIYIVNTTKVIGKSESCGLAVCSRLEGRGNDPHPMLDGSGVKVMPGLIPAPNPGSFNIRKERK